MAEKIHKSFTLRPRHYLDPTTGEILDTDTINKELARDVRYVTELAEWNLLHGHEALYRDVEPYIDADANKPSNYIGRAIGITYPPHVRPRGTGASRQREMANSRTIDEVKSWIQRTRAFTGTSTKHVSQGWARTANPTRPTTLTPRMDLAAADKQYATFANDPLRDKNNVIDLLMLVNRRWVIAVMDFDRARFTGAEKITMPKIRLTDNDEPLFDFTAQYDYTYTRINSTYAVAVDKGITNYVTLALVNLKTGFIEEVSTLSARVHSLWNKIRATERQRNNLVKKGDLLLSQGRYLEARLKWAEAVPYREAAARKKLTLAQLAAQEIAAFAVEHENAVVVEEDLSWIVNTMQNGRWNRGELSRWIKHYAEMNGSRVFQVNAAYTSQLCHLCGGQVLFEGWHVVHCSSCKVTMDRDENAAGNIGLRFKDTLAKVVASREKARAVTDVVVRRSPVVRSSLKYPGRDRSKSKATPKRPGKIVRRYRGEVCVPSGGSARGGVFDRTVRVGERGDVSSSPLRTLERQPGLLVSTAIYRVYQE